MVFIAPTGTELEQWLWKRTAPWASSVSGLGRRAKPVPTVRCAVRGALLGCLLSQALLLLFAREIKAY